MHNLGGTESTFAWEAQVLEKRSPKPEPAALEGLRAAALSAITTFGDATRLAFEDDANPHTIDLSPYDLARLFSPGRGGRDESVTDLDGIAAIIKRTTEPHAAERAAARAHWVAHELQRLGHHKEARRFQALAQGDG